MARATTTTIVSVLLLIHTAAASKDSKLWGCAPVSFSNESHDNLDIDADSDTYIDANQIQYSSSRRQRQQQSKKDGKPSEPLIVGSGRDFTLFDQRGGDSVSSSSDSPPSDNERKKINPFETSGIKRRSLSSNHPTGGGFPTTATGTGTGTGSRRNTSPPRTGGPLAGLREYLSNSGLPKIQCRMEPSTTVKVRKTIRAFKTMVELGADFNTQLGVWQFQSSWEDRIIGGKLTLVDREVQFYKTWLLSVGVVEDLVTRLRLRAAVNIDTGKAYARLGFRTERLSPINIVEGCELSKQLPLDGNSGHIKLEVKANVAFPEPEIEYSTDTHQTFLGMSDIELNVNELNLLLNY